MTGYFVSNTTSGRFFATVPVRSFDTRSSQRFNGTISPIGPASVLSLTMNSQLPTASHITAMLVNVTATNSSAGGYLTVYPTGDNLPTASNLNFKAGQTVANAVIVKLGPTGSGGIRGKSLASAMTRRSFHGACSSTISNGPSLRNTSSSPT